MEANMGCDKVKIFSGSGTKDLFEGLEKEVNEWLAKSDDIEIIQRQITGSSIVSTGELYVMLVIVIFYREQTERIPFHEKYRCG
jgi:hypothetical protein